MEFRTMSGEVLTDEMIEELGAACERGEYPGKPGKIIVAPVGRPHIFPREELITVAFKIPKSYREKLDTSAKQRNETRSEYLREVLENALGMF